MRLRQNDVSRLVAITFSYLFVAFHMEPTPPPSTDDHLNMSPSPPFGRHKWMVISILPECRPSHFQITGGPKCLVPRYVGGPFAVMYKPPHRKSGGAPVSYFGIRRGTFGPTGGDRAPSLGYEKLFE